MQGGVRGTSGALIHVGTYVCIAKMSLERLLLFYSCYNFDPTFISFTDCHFNFFLFFFIYLCKSFCYGYVVYFMNIQNLNVNLFYFM